MKYDRHFPIAITYDSDQDNNYHRMIKLFGKIFLRKLFLQPVRERSPVLYFAKMLLFV